MEMGKDDKSPGSGGPRTQLAEIRTFLANERTFLAWLRTGFELIILGLITAEFLMSGESDARNTMARALATGMIAVGVVVALFGARRYFIELSQIEADRPKASRRTVAITTILVAAIGLASVAFVILLQN